MRPVSVRTRRSTLPGAGWGAHQRFEISCHWQFLDSLFRSPPRAQRQLSYTWPETGIELFSYQKFEEVDPSVPTSLVQAKQDQIVLNRVFRKPSICKSAVSSK